MANIALRDYLSAQFGVDVASFDGQGGGQRAMAEAGIPQHHIDSVIAGFVKNFDPVTGEALHNSSYGDLYGSGQPSQHRVTGLDLEAQNDANTRGVQSMVDNYTTTIQSLTDRFGELQNRYATDVKSATDTAGALRQQLLFGGGPGGSYSDTAGVARARFQGAGRGRRSLLGGMAAGDASLGAQLI